MKQRQTDRQTDIFLKQTGRWIQLQRKRSRWQTNGWAKLDRPIIKRD